MDPDEFLRMYRTTPKTTSRPEIPAEDMHDIEPATQSFHLFIKIMIGVTLGCLAYLLGHIIVRLA